MTARWHDQERRQWQHTALLAAILANANRDPKRRAFTVDDFMPRRREKLPDVRAEDFLATLGMPADG